MIDRATGWRNPPAIGWAPWQGRLPGHRRSAVPAARERERRRDGAEGRMSPGGAAPPLRTARKLISRPEPRPAPPSTRRRGWTCGAVGRMLPRSQRGAYALQGRCRATPATAIAGHWPDGVFRVARTAPVGPTHAVCATTGATVCGIKAEDLEVLNVDWEAACFVEKCPDCFAAVLAGGT